MRYGTCFFRSKINLSPRTQIYDTQIYDEKCNTFRKLRSQDIEDGALQLLNALSGSYKDSRGNARPVKGDIAKLAYVPGLRSGARKLLQNLKHISTELPGTQEARKQMRHEIKAMRIRYGVPIFVTVSPDEAHQWLFIRMARPRESDPIRRASPWQEWTCGDENSRLQRRTSVFRSVWNACVARSPPGSSGVHYSRETLWHL